jgi:small subunit ribosomal protein S17
MAEQRKTRASLQGVVRSSKMDKTAVVEVQHRVLHRQYKKYVIHRVRYKAHDEKNECRKGDVVRIVSSRPLSREKRWRVHSFVERAN